MPKYILFGRIQDRFHPINNNLWREIITKFNGWDVTVTVDTHKKRSNQQNRYYWGGVIPILQHTLKELGNDFTQEQCHSILKCKFLKETAYVNESTREFIDRIKSTTELSTNDFEDYLENIRAWMQEFFSVDVPLPEKQMELPMNK